MYDNSESNERQIAKYAARFSGRRATTWHGHLAHVAVHGLEARATSLPQTANNGEAIVKIQACLMVIAVLVIAHPGSLAAAGSTAPTESAAQRTARMKWWQEARFGMFIHWGPVSLKGTEIGWSRNPGPNGARGSIPAAEYDSLYKQFNPVKFSAREWVATAKAAGMKYMVFTSKHHDGFCEFDSRLTDHKITNPQSPFHRDVVKELAEACRVAGIRFGVYYSQPDCASSRLPHCQPCSIHQIPARPGGRIAEQLRADRRDLVRRPGRVGQGLGCPAAVYFDPAAAAGDHYQRPLRPDWRLQHARADDRGLSDRPALGNLHDDLQPVGVEAQR